MFFDFPNFSKVNFDFFVDYQHRILLAFLRCEILENLNNAYGAYIRKIKKDEDLNLLGADKLKCEV